MKKLVSFIALPAALLYAVVVSGGEAYYVQSLKAKIMSAPSFKSGVLGEAAKGTRLVSSGREGSWVKVSFKGKDGYVSSMLLSNHAPLERVSMITGEEGVIKQSVRRRASTYTSAAAARGLAADDRRRLSRDEKTDYGALEKIETFTLSADDVARFMEGKKL